MAELKDYNNPYAFIDEDAVDTVYAEFTQRCKDLLNTLDNIQNYFEHLQGISSEEFAQLYQNTMESNKVLHDIDGYSSDLTNQMSYMHGVLTR